MIWKGVWWKTETSVAIAESVCDSNKKINEESNKGEHKRGKVHVIERTWKENSLNEKRGEGCLLFEKCLLLPERSSSSNVVSYTTPPSWPCVCQWQHEVDYDSAKVNYNGTALLEAEKTGSNTHLSNNNHL